MRYEWESKFNDLEKRLNCATGDEIDANNKFSKSTIEMQENKRKMDLLRRKKKISRRLLFNGKKESRISSRAESLLMGK